jgi:hypothetical protein
MNIERRCTACAVVSGIARSVETASLGGTSCRSCACWPSSRAGSSPRCRQRHSCCTHFKRALINDLLRCRFIHENAPAHIVGPVGSHLAQAIGQQAVRQGHKVHFAKPSQFFAALYRSRLSGVHGRRMKMPCRVRLLILDDFAPKPIGSPQDDDLHEMIAQRYEKMPILITSNLAVDEWHEAFADNKLLGAATIDRLKHGAYTVTLDGPSHRTPRTGAPPMPVKAAQMHREAPTKKQSKSGYRKAKNEHLSWLH